MAYNPRDAFYKKAKREGYRSRAAYKLLELHQRFRLIKPGDRIVDLGAAPGGWLQIAAKLAGPKGKVMGVDLQRIEPLNVPNVVVVEADIDAPELQQQISDWLGAPADLVLSDLSPKLSGIPDADASRTAELNRAALAAAIRLLRRGGGFLVKSFVGEELQSFTAELKKHFRSVQRTRPEASRRGSSEIYFYAKEFFNAEKV